MGQESPGHVPSGAGGAGGWSGHHVLRGLAGRLSSTEKAAKLGCFGLKIPGGDRESLKGNVKKKKKKKKVEHNLVTEQQQWEMNLKEWIFVYV